MKKHCWLTLGLMVATVAVAQNNTSTAPTAPAPEKLMTADGQTAAIQTFPAEPGKTNAPAKKAATKKRKVSTAATKKTPSAEPTIALVPGPAEVTVSNLIVRGQAGLQGEVVTHLFKGDAVTVLSQINLDKHAADEPAQWAKIALPSTVHVWLNGKFIDASSKVVSAKKLNLRAGPGENYSVVGLLEKGAPVSEVETKGDWIKIEAPTNAFAFVAAMYLKQEAAVPTVITPAPAPTPEPAPAPTPTPVPEAQPIVTAPPPVVPVTTETAPPPAIATSVPAPTAEVDTNVPPAPRVVMHEGVVRHVGSLITPTAYELYNPTTDINVNFLYTTTTNLDLSRYVGMKVIVTGEEGLAARWTDIPVLTIQRIQVIDTNVAPQSIYQSPRAAGQRH
jgi:uncharacterized protein YgiM (DUF1202 family)